MKEIKWLKVVWSNELKRKVLFEITMHKNILIINKYFIELRKRNIYDSSCKI